MRKDFLYAYRLILKTPTLSLAAILSLGVGIGVSTSLFAVIRAVILRPLPYHEPDRLVVVGVIPRQQLASGGNLQDVLTGAEIRAVSGLSTVFQQTTAFEPWTTSPSSRQILTGVKDAQRLRGNLVSENFFDVLGIQAARGRVFHDRTALDQIVISDGLWRRQFGADPGVLGKTIAVDNGNKEIIGVLPPLVRFTYPQDTDFWAIRPDPTFVSSILEYHLVARLQPGVSVQQADAALADASKTARGGGRDPDRLLFTKPLQSWITQSAVPAFRLLSMTVALLLLAACANATLLLVARSARSGRDNAVRSALGANRGHLLRQSVAETASIGICGAGLALVFSLATRPLIDHIVPSTVPRIDEVRLDPLVAGFVLATTGLAWFITWVGSYRSSKNATSFTLDKLNATSTLSKPRLFRRRVLLATQAAITVVLLVTAGLLVKSFWTLTHIDTGFRSDNLIAFQTRIVEGQLAMEQFATRNQPDHMEHGVHEHAINLRETLFKGIKELPGITDAAVSSTLPFWSFDESTFVPQGSRTEERPRVHARSRYVSPEFFRLFSIPIIEGRPFAESDVKGAPKVAIISASLAKALYRDKSALGQPLEWGEKYDIVGIAGDVRWKTPDLPAEPAFYLPAAQHTPTVFSIIAKTSLDEKSFEASVLGLTRSLIPNQPLDRIVRIGRLVDDSTTNQRFYAVVSISLAILATLLGAIGIFGAVEAAVGERIREIGVRIALGATPRKIWSLAIRQGIEPIAIGLLLGGVVSVLATQPLQKFLFSAHSFDLIVLTAAEAALLAVAVVACIVPARHAVRVDPMTILRPE